MPNNKIEIVYNAAGEKLEKQVYTGATLSTHKRYVMGIEYTGTTLEAIYHAEGRIVPIGGGVFRYEYTLKDHLGNTRLMFAANGTAIQLLQENHFYPFGMEMKGAWITQVGTENGYQYNGKELNEDWGLNWSDYGARWYDASVGRWNAVDPLAENSLNFSSYNYTLNNPLIFVDPDGRDNITYIFVVPGSSLNSKEKDAIKTLADQYFNHLGLKREVRFIEGTINTKNFDQTDNLVVMGNTSKDVVDFMKANIEGMYGKDDNVWDSWSQETMDEQNMHPEHTENSDKSKSDVVGISIRGAALRAWNILSR